MSEYLLNNCRVFDTSDDPDITSTFTAGFYVDIKYPLQPLCPRHRGTFFGRGLVGRIGWLGLFTFAPSDRCYPCAVLTVGCEHSVKAGEVYSGPGNQGDQPGYKIQRFKYDMGGAVAPRCSPKAPTFGSVRTAPCRFGSSIAALSILLVL